MTVNIKFFGYIATSLDGYIARPNGKLDWLNDAAPKDSKEDYGYHKFMLSIDCVLMGRASFEKVASFPEWPYKDKRVFVLSRTMKEAPKDLEDYEIDFFNGAVERLAVELQTLGMRNVYVDGGMTLQSFIRAEMLDEIIITQLPILIGKGLALFTDCQKDIKLALISSQSFDSGFVQNRYRFTQQKGRYFDE